MPRKPDPTLKPMIVSKVAQHLQETKLEDVSVRSLGRVLGTSAYPIVYHFGTRDALVDAVVEHLAESTASRTLDPDTDTAGLADWLVAVFGGLDDPERALAARLTFELGSVESLCGRDREHTVHRAQIDAVAAWCRAHGQCATEAARTAQNVVLVARGIQWGAVIDPAQTDADGALRTLAADMAAGAAFVTT
jgi:AcrR family transcriptional regulator